MAIKLNERYPGRANPASVDYPQGSFKNRTSPTSKDGTYLEQDWANDKEGFFQSLLSVAGITANGQVDKVGASQYFNAIYKDPTETLRGMPLAATNAEVKAGTNTGKMVTPAGLNPLMFGRLNRVFKITTSTTYTPLADSKHIIVTVQGGGGSGGGAGPVSSGFAHGSGGGGAGGACQMYMAIDSTIRAGVSVTVGAGGAASAGVGNSGGTSSFGSYMSATGGIGGLTLPQGYQERAQMPGGSGGTGSGGNIFNSIGGPGGAVLITAASNALGGNGGSSIYSGGGSNSNADANGASGFEGSGGAGAICRTVGPYYSGGAGGNGFVLIMEFA